MREKFERLVVYYTDGAVEEIFMQHGIKFDMDDHGACLRHKVTDGKSDGVLCRFGTFRKITREPAFSRHIRPTRTNIKLADADEYARMRVQVAEFLSRYPVQERTWFAKLTERERLKQEERDKAAKEEAEARRKAEELEAIEIEEEEEEEEEEQPAEPVKRKPGRPKGSKNKPNPEKQAAKEREAREKAEKAIQSEIRKAFPA